MIENIVYGNEGSTTGVTLLFKRVHINETKVMEERPAVYMIYGKDNQLLYIGETSNLKNRIIQHRSKKNGNKHLNYEIIGFIDYCYLQMDRYERSVVEGLLVMKYSPALNCDDEKLGKSRISKTQGRLTEEQRLDVIYYAENTNFSVRGLAEVFKISEQYLYYLKRQAKQGRFIIPENYEPKTVVPPDTPIGGVTGRPRQAVAQ
jgi:GIY-YIG catalytic domain